MAYLPVWILLAIGLVMVIVVAVRLWVVVRRLAIVRTAVVGRLDAQAGLVRARAAGVRLGIDQRFRRHGSGHGSRAAEPDVGTIEERRSEE